ncbi:MAG: F0F1 ATP synthase subunit B [Planctomycetes bacterium]|nr:F0F1 ATP synthase subunit B [Planctomycetota bacterium]
MNVRPNGRRDHRRALVLVAAVMVMGLCAAAAWAAPEEQRSLTQRDRIWNAVVATVTFLVLVVILGRFAWKPVLRAMQAREQALADIVAETQRRKSESEELLAEYKARLTAAEEDVAAMIERSREQAEATREEIVAHAKKQAAAAIAEAQRQIDQAKREALNEIYRNTANLATDVASKIVRKEITPADHDRLVDESLKRLGEES